MPCRLHPLEMLGRRTCTDKPIILSDTSHIQCTCGNQAELLAFYTPKRYVQDLPVGRSLSVSGGPQRAIQMLGSVKNKTVSQSLSMQVQRPRLHLGDLLKVTKWQRAPKYQHGNRFDVRKSLKCYLWCTDADSHINKQALNQTHLVFLVSLNII